MCDTAYSLMIGTILEGIISIFMVGSGKAFLLDNLSCVRLLKRYYNASPSKALQAVYPHHQWLPWMFHKFTKSMLSRTDEKQLLDWLSPKLHIKTLDDWYRVSIKQIRQIASLVAVIMYVLGIL